jgi:hypothetical protein
MDETRVRGTGVNLALLRARASAHKKDLVWLTCFVLVSIHIINIHVLYSRMCTCATETCSTKTIWCICSMVVHGVCVQRADR